MTEKNSNQIVSKNAMAQFVREAAEMEVRVYTLREMAKETRKEAATTTKKPKAALANTEQQISRAEQDLKRAENTKRACEKFVPEDPKFKWSGVLLGAWFFLAFVGAVFVGIWAGVGAILELAETTITLCVVISLICVFLIGLCLAVRGEIKSNEAEHTKSIQKNQKEKQDAVQSIQLNQQKLQRLNGQQEKDRDQLHRAELVAQRLTEQANDFDEQAQSIYALLQECYAATNIVPADYRSIDCVVIFNHVFRNDLADTMRQAVFYYEEKQFRDLVLRGVENIYQMLGQLANVVVEVRDTLLRIENDVMLMSRELSGIAESQKQAVEMQENIWKENRAARYAAEEYYASQQAHNGYVRNQIHWNS